MYTNTFHTSNVDEFSHPLIKTISSSNLDKFSHPLIRQLVSFTEIFSTSSAADFLPQYTVGINWFSPNLVLHFACKWLTETSFQ